MQLILAPAPILAAVVLLLVFRQPMGRSGLFGLVVAAAVAWLHPAFRLAPAAILHAAVSGALTSLVVAYILLGGLIFYYVLGIVGAFEVVARILVDGVADPARRALLLIFGVSVFFEASTGAGIGIIVLAPVFIAMGFDPRRAVLLSLLGLCAAPWGALSIGTMLGSALTGVPSWRMGWIGAVLSAPHTVRCIK
jgi:lactate permease